MTFPLRKLQCNPQALEKICPGAASSIWNYATTDVRKAVLRDGYFNNAAHVGLRRHDRIFVIARMDKSNPVAEAEYVIVTVLKVKTEPPTEVVVHPIDDDVIKRDH